MDKLSTKNHHYVYIVQCANGAFYTGYTKNVEQRVAVHNSGKGARYTRANRPVVLVACCQFQSKSEALQIEYAIKKLPRHKKLVFMQSMLQT
jgi:putative endonuclease